jgi:hypothetical protein
MFFREYKEEYRGKQSKAPILSEKLGSAIIGPKEESGQTHCEKPFVQYLDDPKRFITNYQVKYVFLATDYIIDA